MDLSDPFEQFRKNKSYTFNRRTSSGKLQNRIARYLNSHLNGNINLSLLCLFCSRKVMTIMRYSHANLFTIDEHIFNVHTAWLTCTSMSHHHVPLPPINGAFLKLSCTVSTEYTYIALLYL